MPATDSDRAPADEEAIEVRVPVEALVEALSDPRALGAPADADVTVHRTHISVVFVSGDRAWKVKRPLRLWGLLDYGTVARRRSMCETEVRLNRRLAPDIYRGVAPIRRDEDGRIAVDGPGEVVEHAVVMERVPAEATLACRLEAGAVDEPEMADLGRLLAAFHAGHRLRPEEAHRARPSAFAAVLRQNVRATADAVGTLFPADVHEGLRRALTRRLAGERRRIRRRIAAGRAVDGHGDLRADHVVLHEGAIRVMDCVEFTPRLRHLDPLSDLAFLVMDLRMRGHRPLADALLAAYVDEAGSPGEDVARLLPLFLAYRAHVRAKVGVQTLATGDLAAAAREEEAGRARAHLALAAATARTGTPALVVLHGLSGTGKSALARRLAPLLDAVHLQSDVIRKELAGLAPTDRPGGEAREALYGEAMSARTYATLLERAERAVREGRCALLDATFIDARGRRDARALAATLGAPLLLVDLAVPPDVVRRRLRQRAEAGGDPSDADLAVYEQQREAADPLDEAERAEALAVGEEPDPPGLALALLGRMELAP